MTWRRAVAAIIALAIVVTLIITRSEPAVSASDLLTASTRAEAARVEQRGFVARRAFTIEARRVGDLKPLRTQHVEVWVHGTARIKARRLFDDRRRLLAGEWTSADGSRVVYERGKPPRNEPATVPRPLTLGTIWRWEPSAVDFSQIAGPVDRVTARATADGFELSVDEARGQLAHADLTLDKDHRPVAQRVILHEGGEDIEVRTKRTASEELPESQVVGTSFDPDAELLQAPPPSVVATAPAAGPSVSPSTPSVPMLTEQALDAVELQTWFRLHHLAGCLAQPGELRRRDGQFAVRVVVGPESCRAEAARTFAELAATPGVSVDLAVVPSQAGPLVSAPTTPDASRAADDLGSDEALVTIPAYRLLYDFHARQALRDPQSSRDVDAAVNPLIRRLAVWVRDRSTRRVAVARELQRLAERWSPDTLKPLGLDAASMWQSMVRDHARTLVDDTELLIAQIEPALGVTGANVESSGRTVRSLTDVRNAIAELQELVRADDVDIRRLFTPPDRGGTVQPAPEGERVIQALRRTARLATRLTEPWALDK